MTHYRYTPVLVHHGIKGMHWGIRRDKTSGSSQRKTSKAYDDYKKAIRAFENAEHLSTDNKRHYSGMTKALQMEKEAKRNFTREDKKQVKADRKENRRQSKENMLKARYSPEELAKRERTKTYAKRGAIAAAGILATSIGTIAISKLIDNRRNNPVNFKKNSLAREYLKNSFDLPLLPRVSKPGKEMPTFPKSSTKPGASFEKLFG